MLETPQRADAEEAATRTVDEAIQKLAGTLPDDDIQSLAQEVIRRMAARHRGERPAHHDPPPAEDIEALSKALISDDQDAASQFIDGLRMRGIAIDDLYLTYLAGAARRLGELWDNDTLSFVDVTIGTGRILAVLHTLDQTFFPGPSPTGQAAFFAGVPGEIHTLGVRMACDLFSREGWDIELAIDMSHDELVHRAAEMDRNLIGLSAGGVHSSSALAKLVVALRIAKPKAAILVSGKIVTEARDLVMALEPDAVAVDMPSAREEMKRLWESLSVCKR